MRKGKGFQALRQTILAFLSLSVLGAAGLASLAYLMDKPPASMPVSSIFHVRPGDSAGLVAKRLEESGLIHSRHWFIARSRLSGKAGLIKAGTYDVQAGMTTSDILYALAEGRLAVVRVTIPEGYTLGQTASILEANRVCQRADFIAAASNPSLLEKLKVPAQSAEGYLFPDTYAFPPQSEASQIVTDMVTAFRSALSREASASASLSEEELHEKVILASIVEREYRIADEAPLMASVFSNRVRIGMALQSCATVVYALTERLGQAHPEILSKQDIAVKDPYNTYLQRGLPPGPISNPGLVALRAVLDPPRTQLLYFRLIDPATGTHHFSRTLDEHNQAGAFYTKKPGSSR